MDPRRELDGFRGLSSYPYERDDNHFEKIGERKISQEKAIETAQKIVEGLSTLKGDESLSDFKVIVGEKEFSCHSSVLAANSDFFKAAFRGGMKEAQEGRILLEGVTVETFSSLLTCLYEGKYVLTEENFFDLWAAANMLQIRFIIDQCVEMCQTVLDTKLSKENCIDYLCKVRLLNEQAGNRVLTFICKAFTDPRIQRMSHLLKEDEVRSLVTSDDLVVCTEEFTLQFVLDWAERNQKSLGRELPEEDPSYQDTHSSDSGGLADLIGTTRYMLIGDSFLHGTLARNPLVAADSRCRRLVDEITWYHSQPCLHQSWCPPAAIHRKLNDMTNALLLCKVYKDNSFRGLDLKDMTWKTLDTREQFTPESKVFSYNSEIYVTSSTEIKRLSTLALNWQSTNCCKIDGMVRVVNDSLREYVCTNSTDESMSLSRFQILALSRSFTSRQREKICRGEIIIKDKRRNVLQDATSIGSTEIFFFNKKGDNGYMILSVNVFGSSGLIYPNQLGSSSLLVTFRHDKEVFVLQENGCLWRIQLGDEPLHIHIENVLVLWDGDIPLNGAVLYNDELLVVGDFKDQSEVSVPMDICLPSVFKRVRKIKLSGDDDKDCPGVALAVLCKSSLLPSEPDLERFNRDIIDFSKDYDRYSTCNVSRYNRDSGRYFSQPPWASLTYGII